MKACRCAAALSSRRFEDGLQHLGGIASIENQYKREHVERGVGQRSQEEHRPPHAPTPKGIR